MEQQRARLRVKTRNSYFPNTAQLSKLEENLCYSQNQLPIRCSRFSPRRKIVGFSRRFKRRFGSLLQKQSIPISQNFDNSRLRCRLNRPSPTPRPNPHLFPTYSFIYGRLCERTHSRTKDERVCLRTFQRNCYNSGADGVQLKARLFARHLYPTGRGEE